MSDFDNTSETFGDVFDMPQLKTDVDEEPGDFGHSMNFAPNVQRISDQKTRSLDDDTLRDNFDELPTSYQTFIHRSKYARYRDDLGRRETWSETVDRYIGFFNGHLKTKCGYSLTEEDRADVRNAIGKLQVMPSMRALMTAGPALARDNIAGYNCAFVAVEDQRAFDEILYVLMNGTGVGFSVERQYVANLPAVPEFKRTNDKHVINVGDSKEGWAFALQQMLSFLYHGIIPTWDLSALRPAGARLMTFGGRSSGPKPLDDLFKFIITVFKVAQGRKLQSIEVHDIVCKIAEIVVVGGVRRCIPKGALVSSDRGLIPIEEITVGDNVMTADGYRPVTNVFVQGVQNLVRINTENGTFSCTPGHRMAVNVSNENYSWKMAQDIDVKNDQLVACHIAISGSETQLPGISENQTRHSKHKKFVIPELDQDMAWYIGLVQTDANMAWSLDDSANVLQYADRARSQILRFCPGLCVNISRKSEFSRMHCGSSRLNWYLANAITFHTIPDCILRGPLQIRLAYLEGSAIARQAGIGHIEPGLIYIADQLRILAASCGKNLKVNGTIDHMWFGDRYTGHYEQINKIEDSPVTDKLTGVCIRDIENCDSLVETFDIEVDGRHEFICNGFLTHNSALISLSNLSDDRMRSAKSGEWWKDNPQRALANNSVAYTEKPEIGRFMKEWISLYESKSGERGLFNRKGAQDHVRKTCPNRNPNQDFSSNPCNEIILRNREFCNLSEVVVRADDTPDTLKNKVRVATVLGTWQSSLTDFQYISERWKKNCEEEHLLGVSLTGIMDNTFMSGMKNSESEDSARPTKRPRRGAKSSKPENPWAGRTLPEFLEELKSVAIETNRIWAKKLNIDVSAAITTVKPSGTVSQLVDSASGIHTRHAKHYIRTVRSDVKDPMTKFLQDEGVPWEPCAMKPNDTVVFSFPIKAPDVCITRDDQTALQQLEICKIYNEHWCQHKVSVTINVKEPEWMRVGSWIWDNFDTTSGISFLPHSEHTYQQAPYQECDEAAYLAMVARMPKINWKKLRRYESTDLTSGVKELACTAGGCEI